MAKTATTNTTTNTDMVLMVNDDDIDDSNKEIERQIWDNDKLNNDHGYYSYSYHDPLGVIFIDNWSLLFGFSIGLGLGMGIAFGMVSMVEKLLPQTSSIIQMLVLLVLVVVVAVAVAVTVVISIKK